MHLTNNYSNYCFSSTYRDIVRYTRNLTDNTQNLFILEGAEKLIKEELVRCIWFGQHIEKDKLYTDNGKRLEILSPGWWNNEEGPDFIHAEILLEGTGYIKGNIEVHVLASDWAKHGHEKQKTYNEVCLHVVLWNDHQQAFVRNFSQHVIPQLTLSKYLDAELDEIIETINVEVFLRGEKVIPGWCKQKIEKQKVSKQSLGQFLDYAGDERILQKAKRFEKWTESKPFEQAFYEAILESLGYKNNKKPFLLLASILPLDHIRMIIPDDASVLEKKITIQSLLLGMADLLPQDDPEKKDYDDETTTYLHRINSLWQEIYPKINQTPLVKDNWSYTGMRPANYPERRIAAIACILSDHVTTGLFRHILFIVQKKSGKKEGRHSFKNAVDDILSPFLNACDSYWSYRYTFGGKKFQKPQKLIGKERASAIFINVIIPILLAYARKQEDTKLEEHIHHVYRNYIHRPSTSVSKFMASRIFGTPDASKEIINSARRQQGLYQIFKDFCENNNTSCNKCALYLSIETI